MPWPRIGCLPLQLDQPTNHFVSRPLLISYLYSTPTPSPLFPRCDIRLELATFFPTLSVFYRHYVTGATPSSFLLRRRRETHTELLQASCDFCMIAPCFCMYETNVAVMMTKHCGMGKYILTIEEGEGTSE